MAEKIKKKISKILEKCFMGVCAKRFEFGLPDISIFALTSLVLLANEGLR